METTQDILMRQLNKEKKEADKLKSQMIDQRKKMMLIANEEEDKMIKKLEKQLGLNKSKNKNKNFAEDGLDCILFMNFIHSFTKFYHLIVRKFIFVIFQQYYHLDFSNILHDQGKNPLI